LLVLKEGNLCQLLPLDAIFEIINLSCIALVNFVCCIYRFTLFWREWLEFWVREVINVFWKFLLEEKLYLMRYTLA